MDNNKKPHAIVVALPLQGHVIPSVQLAIKLATKGFSITFINTQYIHHQITTSNPTNTNSNDIFSDARRSYSKLDIEYVTVSEGLPLEYDRSLNHDQWVGATMYCFPAHVEVAVAKIVKCRPSVCCLIADVYSPWASKVAKKYGLVHVGFWTEAALVLDIYFHLHLLKDNGHIGPASGARKDTIQYIPGIRSIKRTDLMSYLQEEDLTTIDHQIIFASIEESKRADIVLANTAQELEAHAISALQDQTNFYAIGPLFQPSFTKSPVATSLWTESDCTQWLNSKPHGSVLYVSFGSYAHISKEELTAIANGIKRSGVNFLWVIRPNMVSSEESDPLPVGFRDEVGDRGMIVTWTCQITVLSHCAIGGFLTHCGWNSTLESIWCEVPLLCYPLKTDQFTNRKLIVDDLEIGHNLCNTKPVKEEEVSHKVQQLVAGSMRHELKDKIKRVKRMIENATLENGSSQRNLDNFIQKLKISCNKTMDNAVAGQISNKFPATRRSD